MKNNSAGFTMIEMLLSMAFVAFLMVTIAMTTISMGQTYEKGLTLNSVNQAGRTIMSDMQDTIQQSSAGAMKQKSLLDGGVLCFGNFSYIYNTGAHLASGDSQLVKYSAGPLKSQPVHLAKVSDAGGSYCASGSLRPVDSVAATELLPSSDRNLAVQSMKQPVILNPNHSPLQTLYQISFVLGTNDQAALVETGDSCRPPTDKDSNTDYCAVNSFQFIVRAGGSK